MSNRMNPDTSPPDDWIVDGAEKLQWLYHDRLKKHVCPVENVK